MQVLFCRPDEPQATDDRFELEAAALDELGVAYQCLAMERVVDDELDHLEVHEDEVLYRGWMLTGEEYTRLDEAAATRGGALVTSPDEYEAAHYLPSWFEAVSSMSPPTRWILGSDIDEAWEAAQELGPPPYIIKDHVKSAKEHWDEACFVPPNADRDTFAGICEALVDLRGDRFERGLVIRRYVPLAAAPGGDGLPDEHRLFFWRGRLVAACPYHDVALETKVPEQFRQLGSSIDSPFFSVDVARAVDGRWLVIEIGDGGVSTMPPTMDPREFYRAIL